ncbi:uncharacterized protein N7484_010746 [Penicillium longicatenatum]|uniref:uncharacterized protein n=1 Tax=Penicillium longicatenatum TaxID=1561947 RepID=UPI002547285A|nr:uncharacterized protein N7484_010746 [Penicillium longicatenatum]KAJ5630646.1 hypothetical protein N7484_010746 [Penicillium longicatenatum]
MVRVNFFLAALALATGALAKTNDDCQTQYNSCRVGPDANMSTCVSEHLSCCADVYDSCRVGADANMAQCAADNAACNNQS